MRQPAFLWLVNPFPASHNLSSALLSASTLWKPTLQTIWTQIRSRFIALAYLVKSSLKIGAARTLKKLRKSERDYLIKQ